jgi:hypothetical protein
VADVFRQGRKSVHRATVSGDPDDPSRPSSCNIDLLPGKWGLVIPPGHRCAVCFAGFGDEERARRGQANTAAAGGVAAVALVAAVFLARPHMNLIPAYYGSGESALASPSASVTPGPSVVPPGPSLAPALTPSPTASDRIIYRLIPVPAPTPRHTNPAPTPPPLPVATCFHPGENKGVDECRWPHN